MIYTLLIKQHVRTSYFDETNSLDAALHHFDTVYGALVRDESGCIYKTKEELENAESIRSEPRTELDSGASSFGEVSESSGSELSETTWDYPE